MGSDETAACETADLCQISEEGRHVNFQILPDNLRTVLPAGRTHGSHPVPSLTFQQTYYRPLLFSDNFTPIHVAATLFLLLND